MSIPAGDVNGKDEVELYFGNISPVGGNFNDPLTWWKKMSFTRVLHYMVILLPVKSWSYCNGFFSSWWANALSTHPLVEGPLLFMAPGWLRYGDEFSFREADERKDLAALARTCKTFQDPALSFLWSKQDTLNNLLRSLPPHPWTETSWRLPGHLPGRQVRLTGPVEPADWEVPLVYALRIRTLTLTSWPPDKFPTADTLQAISSGLPRDYLCPNLRTISWEPNRDTIFPYIMLLLCPRITEATISFPSPSSISLLPTLALAYPALTGLHIGGNLSESEDAALLERIETFSATNLDRAVFHHLSQLPSLRSLRLYGGELQDLRPAHLPPDDTPQDHPFPGLGRPPVAHHSAKPSGRARGATGAAISEYLITGHELAALFCFANLVDVCLVPAIGFDIDDATAWDMARAWPNLQSLKLYTATEFCHLSSMTLHGLRGLAKYCQALKHLAVTFDASMVPPTDDSPETRISQSSLVLLNVGAGAITDSATVARFLSDLFPNLETVATHGAERWEYTQDVPDEMAAHAHNILWKQVDAMLPKLASRSVHQS
ncbi:hypothetical protein DFH07DRAFT_1009021 [Mycena maculata]|uniref:F-box domain-containing protein n=1 Tax=Mycena maculata TaxID=230809 RepID=A0AAD7HH62_9AGAR|nr:hypothetical protein DFH07DRAFT_1009021 [Mycena maculata]